jgi:excisionase family DNA binding protein
MPEKLLTLKELSAYLKIGEDDIRELVDLGELPAYRIGGSFLRFRKEQVDAVKDEVISRLEHRQSKPVAVTSAPVKARESVPAVQAEEMNDAFNDKLRDFFYFNDFYIVSAAIMTVLLYVIFNT